MLKLNSSVNEEEIIRLNILLAFSEKKKRRKKNGEKKMRNKK